jgi:prepilin-type N-terminal cleavage/methylation domain-containing protein
MKESAQAILPFGLSATPERVSRAAPNVRRACFLPLYARMPARPINHESASASTATKPAARRRGFTLFEVMIAATILVLIIATSLTVLQTGMRAVDTARNMTLAGQISQSALEVLRLQNWTQISALPVASDVNISEAISSGTSTTLDQTLSSVTSRFTCTRTVSETKTNMRLITITVSWRGNDGRAHSVSSQARYAKNGLNDYIYVSH